MELTCSKPCFPIIFGEIQFDALTQLIRTEWQRRAVKKERNDGTCNVGICGFQSAPQTIDGNRDSLNLKLPYVRRYV